MKRENRKFFIFLIILGIFIYKVNLGTSSTLATTYLPNDLRTDYGLPGQLDVTFIGDRYPDINIFHQDVERVKKYLLTREPFDEISSKVAYRSVDHIGDFNCQQKNLSDFGVQCYTPLVKTAVIQAGTPYDKIVVIVNGMGQNYGGGDVAVFSNFGPDGGEKAFVHELAHTFGLLDEYAKNQDGPVSNACNNNCCMSSVCIDWQGIAGTTCIQGCGYSNWYRSSETSTMFNYSTEYFNPVSLDLLRKKLKTYTEIPLNFYMPDLSVWRYNQYWSRPHSDFHPGSGDIISFSIEVANGGENIAGPSTVIIRIDENNDGSWNISKEITIGSLEAKELQTIPRIDVWIAKEGIHRFEICVDSGNAIIEKNEDNNCRNALMIVSPSLAENKEDIPGQSPIMPSPTVSVELQETSTVRLSDYSLKEGDLINTVSSDDPDVYIVNGYGYKRLFLNPAIFNFYGHLGGFSKIKKVTSQTRDVFQTSGLFRNCETNDPKVYSVEIIGEDIGQLHWVNTTGDQAVQDDHNFFKKVFCINKKEFDWYPRGSFYNSVKEISAYFRK